MSRVVVLIFHGRPPVGAGELTQRFGRIRERNAERQGRGFREAGAPDVRIVDEPADDRPFGARLRAATNGFDGDGLVVLGSGAIPLAAPADRRALLDAAAGPPCRALANNRYSADVIALSSPERLAALPARVGDNGLPRWLAEAAGFEVGDMRRRWRLQVDLDSPLDALLVGDTLDELPVAPAREALAGVAAVARDPRAELLVAGRLSADTLRWLERSTASRTRALIEERGFRTRAAGQRPVASTLGLLLEREGHERFGEILARLGDAAVVDSRVLMAQRFGADQTGWPNAEDRFASDLLLPERISDPWLRALTAAARDAPMPVLLGGHSLVGPGLRLALAPRRPWT